MQTPSHRRDPHRVLLVGDDNVFRTGLRHAIEASGCADVDEVDPAALSGALGSQVDLAVLDLGSEDPARVAAVRLLKSLDTGQVPHLAVLPEPGEPELERAFEEGAVAFAAREEPAHRVAQQVRFWLRSLPDPSLRQPGDRLTGFCDRKQFLERVTSSMATARQRSHKIAVVCLDVDRLQEIQSRLDRAAAEELTVAIARRLRSTMRDSDTLGLTALRVGDSSLARINGREFTILIEGLQREEDAAKVARRVSEAFERPFSIKDREVPISVSIGIATFPSADKGGADLLKSAEDAASTAKQEGVGSIRFHSPQLNSKAFERLTLETSLRRAIERDELEVHYQPRIDIASGKTVSFEALVRWRHPELGMVSPGQFIPLAEETGLIVPIGEWVLETACAQNRAWQLEGHPPVRVSVNVSSIQFLQRDFYDRVIQVIGRTGLDPRWLELELTESLLMKNAEAAVATLRRFKDAGIHLSIDDFGTGYSSLSYLKRFPIDALKIDQSFIREVTTNSDDAAIATSIILMGRSLKLKVVAEGVETASQLSYLRILQCDEVQGFLYSPPVPADQAVGMITKGFDERIA